METDDRSRPSHQNRIVDGYGFEKLLVLLQDLNRSPSGSVLYQQIERLIQETENTHSTITRAYAAVVLTLIETYRIQLPRESRLYLELQIVQRRLTPPISLNEMASLQGYLRNVATILGKIGSADEDVLRRALGPLLNGSAVTEDAAPEDAARDGNPAPDRGRNNPENPSNHAAMEQHVTSVYRNRLDQQRLEMEKIQKALVEKVDDASHQQQRVADSLTSLLTKLRQMTEVEDTDEIRRQIVAEVDELVSAQSLLTTVLNDSRSLLSKVDDNNEQLRNELSQVHVLSLTDELTQLPNRRAFLRRLEDEIERSQRDKSALTLAMLDLDHFKEVNDRYGHNVGDEILRTYTLEILAIFRRYDMVARYGGEEFAILLPSTDHEGALRAFEKVRSKAAESHCVHGNAKIKMPTFSAGLAVYGGGEPVQTFIDRADKALYKAKQTGRDRIVVDDRYLRDRQPGALGPGFHEV